MSRGCQQRDFNTASQPVSEVAFRSPTASATCAARPCGPSLFELFRCFCPPGFLQGNCFRDTSRPFFPFLTSLLSPVHPKVATDLLRFCARTSLPLAISMFSRTPLFITGRAADFFSAFLPTAENLRSLSKGLYPDHLCGISLGSANGTSHRGPQKASRTSSTAKMSTGGYTMSSLLRAHL